MNMPGGRGRLAVAAGEGARPPSWRRACGRPREEAGRHTIRRRARLPPRLDSGPPWPPPPRTEIRDVNRATTTSRRGLRRQVGHRLRRHRPGAGARQALASCSARAPARSRARSRSAPGPATSRSTCCRRASSARRRAPTSPPGCSTRCEANAARLGLDVETVAADAEALPFEDESFDLVLGHAVLHHLPDLDPLPSRSSSGAPPGGDAVLRRRALAPGDRIAAYPKRAASRLAPAWRAALRARPAPHAAPMAAARHDHALEPSSTCTRSSPTTSAPAAAAGFERRPASAARSCWPTGSAGSTARWRPPPSRGHPVAWIQYAYRGYLAAAAGRPRAARAAPAAADLLQPDARGRASLSATPSGRARPGRSRRRAPSTCSATAARSWTPARPGRVRHRRRDRGPKTAATVAVGSGRDHGRAAPRAPKTGRQRDRRPLGTGLAVLSPCAAAGGERLRAADALRRLALVFAGSVVIRRPLVGFLMPRSRAPSEWSPPPASGARWPRSRSPGRPVRVPRRSSTSC